MIKPLPRIALENLTLAFDDIESLTAIEMTALSYNRIRELVEEHNSFIKKIETEINSFVESTQKDLCCFKQSIIKICHDYIQVMDMHMEKQDKVIADAVAYMKTNLGTTLTEVIREMRDTGELNEHVLAAFDDVLKRLTDTEKDITNINNSITDITNRVKSLEDTKPILTYDENTKEITISNLGGVANG